MDQMGVGAYRFSTSWSRVMPQGYGKINPQGIDFYKRLTEALLNKGIEPYLTLYHWDLPQVLQDKGGWLNRDTAKAFEEYASQMVHHLGDQVKHWMTHNEMWCTAMLGHYYGVFAPGMTDLKSALQTSHEVLVSHGLAIKAMRSLRSDLHLGIAPNYLPSYPQNPDSADDRRAASNFDGFFNRWFLDPLTGRGYPEDMKALYGEANPVIQPGDMEIIAQKIDFLGVNYYNANWYTLDPQDPPLYTQKVDQPQLALTADRDIYPQGLYDTLARLHGEYGFENLFVTENGAAYPDEPSAEDPQRIHDTGRVQFLKDHFAQAARAIQDGIPLKGYFVWSFMDNFEWAQGYHLRYGLHYVDYKTQQRTPKDSALWYRDFIANGSD